MFARTVAIFLLLLPSLHCTTPNLIRRLQTRKPELSLDWEGTGRPSSYQNRFAKKNPVQFESMSAHHLSDQQRTARVHGTSVVYVYVSALVTPSDERNDPKAKCIFPSSGHLRTLHVLKTSSLQNCTPLQHQHRACAAHVPQLRKRKTGKKRGRKSETAYKQDESKIIPRRPG